MNVLHEATIHEIRDPEISIVDHTILICVSNFTFLGFFQASCHIETNLYQASLLDLYREILDLSLLFNFVFSLFYLASPQGQGHHNGVNYCGPVLPNPLSTFPVGGNKGTRRKPTTFGRTPTIIFSHKDWIRVHIKMNLERQVV